MPTDKPRVTFTISKEKLEELESYRYKNRIKNQTQAILSLIDKGLSAFEPEDDLGDSTKVQKNAPLYSSEAEKQLVSLHRELNQEGQEKLADYADDLVSSGKYIKNRSNRVDQAKEA